MLDGSITLGKIAGIKIAISSSLIFAAMLLAFWMADRYFPYREPGYSTLTYYTMGSLAAVLFFASILLHELAHAIMAKFFGLSVHRIILNIIGGLAEIKQPSTAVQDFWIALMGPVTSAGLGFISLLSSQVPGTSPAADQVLLWLGQTNLLLAGFNILPGFPLDGGRVMRASIWYFTGNYLKATRFAAMSGQVFAVILIGLGLLEWWTTGNLFSSMWTFLIAWFLWSVAKTQLRQARVQSLLQDVPVLQALSSRVTLDWDWTLIYALDMMTMHGSGRTAPVQKDNEIVGVFSLENAIRVPRLNWGTIRVGHLMRSLVGLPTVHPNTDLLDTLQQMEQANADYVIVQQDQEMMGIIGRHELLIFAERRRRAAAG